MKPQVSLVISIDY